MHLDRKAKNIKTKEIVLLVRISCFQFILTTAFFNFYTIVHAHPLYVPYNYSKLIKACGVPFKVYLLKSNLLKDGENFLSSRNINSVEIMKLNISLDKPLFVMKTKKC